MNKKILLSLLVILCCAGVFLNFKQFHEDMPRGCDEFGYLNLSKAFDEHKAFQSHTARPYLDGLLDTLRKESITEFEMDYMVAPLAYYVLPGTNKIINMYPPGTSYILSLFPIEYRKMIFPLLVVLLFLLIPLLVLKNDNAGLNWFHLSLFIFLLIIIQLYPLKAELMRINSLGLTFGLLLAAGIALETRPLLTCALIALSSNFRLINLLMIVPLIVFVPFPKTLSKESLIYLVKLFFKYLFVVLLCISPYMLYVYNLLGNPLAPTYSSLDTAMNGGLKNILFYFSFEQKYFIFHLLIAGMLIYLTYKKKISTSFFLKLLLFPLLNYFYFSFKSITMNYYPYASAFILLGVCFNEYGKLIISAKQKKTITIICITISILVFGGGIFEYVNKEHTSFSEAKENYKGLCNYQIVWGDDYPGTSEYICNNSGFMFFRTSAKPRNIAMKYLSNHHYSQAVLLKDNLIKSEVLNELDKINLKYHIVSDNFMGEILVIE